MSYHTTISTLGFVFLLGLSASLVAGDSRGLGRVSPQKSANEVVTGKYRAIVIGNNAYSDPKQVWRPLKTAINDAEAVAKLLKENYGFSDVDLIKNGTRRRILSALNDLRARVKKEDSVLVYYAGHGWRNEATQEAFWIPVDAEGADDSFYLSNVRIKEKLSVIADIAAHTLLISDSCFSGTLLDSRGMREGADKADNITYYRKVAKRKSVQILAAGGNEFVDDNYRGSGHSPFTYIMLNELKNNEQPYLTLANLAINIEQQVARNSDQTPQSGAFRRAGDEGGQFIFSRRGISTIDDMAHDSGVTPSDVSAQATQVPVEFSDWQKTNHNSANEILAYIKKYPDGSITDVAKVKYQTIMSKINALLKSAENDMHDERYLEPAGSNAKQRYLEVLQLDSDNQNAKQGLQKLSSLLIKKANYLVRKERFDQALFIADEVGKIAPDINDVMQLQKSIKIASLLKSAEDNMDADRYVNPENKNAKSDYLAVLEVDNKNAKAKQGLHKIAQRFISQAEKHIYWNRFSQAEDSLSEAEKIDPQLREISQLRKKIHDKRARHDRSGEPEPRANRAIIAPPPSF